MVVALISVMELLHVVRRKSFVCQLHTKNVPILSQILQRNFTCLHSRGFSCVLDDPEYLFSPSPSRWRWILVFANHCHHVTQGVDALNDFIEVTYDARAAACCTMCVLTQQPQHATTCFKDYNKKSLHLCQKKHRQADKFLVKSWPLYR